MTNRLAAESSPYLRQHAENPVDWYPWGDEALAEARRRDVPILLSIGCGTAPIDTEGEAPTVIAPPPTRAELVDEPPPVRGVDGELLESDERVVGLVLPRGLETVSEMGGRHVRVDGALVRERLDAILQDQDLSRFIL